MQSDTIKPAAINAQFGLPNTRGGEGGANTFEQLNKMAAERMGEGDKQEVAGGLAGLGDLSGIGDMMKDLDPATLQELMMEGMKDPQVQEMVRE